jgi:hypothetical protein
MMISGFPRVSTALALVAFATPAFSQETIQGFEGAFQPFYWYVGENPPRDLVTFPTASGGLQLTNYQPWRSSASDALIDAPFDGKVSFSYSTNGSGECPANFIVNNSATTLVGDGEHEAEIARGDRFGFLIGKAENNVCLASYQRFSLGITDFKFSIQSDFGQEFSGASEGQTSFAAGGAFACVNPHGGGAIFNGESIRNVSDKATMEQAGVTFNISGACNNLEGSGHVANPPTPWTNGTFILLNWAGDDSTPTRTSLCDFGHGHSTLPGTSNCEIDANTSLTEGDTVSLCYAASYAIPPNTTFQWAADCINSE